MLLFVIYLLLSIRGFIQLPTHLSILNQLDDKCEADISLHVVDIYIKIFKNILIGWQVSDIGAGDKPTFLIFNKIDAFSYTPKDEDDLTPKLSDEYSLDDFKHMYFARQETCVFISAKHKQNIEEFKQLLYDKVKEMHAIRYPYNNFLY